jgi:polysaccharide deacetylase family protein (PEP-CTERM system associated)
MRNALTFDVEEYFQVESFKPIVRTEDWSGFPSRVGPSTHRILDLLDRREVRGTFFVLGWVGERQPELVREIHARGHEVACHGYGHQVIQSMTPAEFRADVRSAKATLEDAIGAPVRGYRAPTFSIMRGTLWALDVLAEVGFQYDSSIFPIRHDRYGIPEAPRFPHRIPLRRGGDIVEFPMTTVPLAGQRVPVAGGGYFRLLPYPLIAAGIRGVNERERMPAIVYLHPWELDPEQPRLPVRGLSRFRHYVNLQGTAAKLERLLDDFAFASAAEVLAECSIAAVQR